MKLSLIICLSLLSAVCSSQSCAPDFLFLTRQGQVDSFNINYPGCKVLEGDLFLQGPGISNLNGLQQITRIEGILSIQSTSLISTSGLSSATFDEAYIYYNNSLKDLAAFTKIDSLSILIIKSNPQLTDYSGLAKLKKVGEISLLKLPVTNLYFLSPELSFNLFELHELNSLTDLSGFPKSKNTAASIEVYNNSGLMSLNGLQGWKELHGLWVDMNINLRSLTGLDSLTTINWLRFDQNPKIKSLHGLRKLSHPVNFTINSTDSLFTLDGLQSLKHVRSKFNLENNTSLLTTSHLISFDQAGAISIESNPVLQNLSGFKLLKRVGAFIIRNNQALTSLYGLDSLKVTGGLYLTGVWTHLNNLRNLDTINNRMEIAGNDQLNDISSLSSVSFIGGFILKNNPLLKEIPEFPNLTAIKFLEIINNDSLVSLTGLRHLRTISGVWAADFTINDNALLTSLTGLDLINMNNVDELHIENNPLLSHCHVQSICSYVRTSKEAIITNNSDGCESKYQIETRCLVATDDPELSNLFLYPNPTNGFIQLSGWPTGSKCYVTDLFGRPVHTWNIDHEVLDLTENPPGIYFLHLERNGHIKTMKVVKITP